MDAELGGMALAAALGAFSALALGALIALRLRADGAPAARILKGLRRAP